MFVSVETSSFFEDYIIYNVRLNMTFYSGR